MAISRPIAPVLVLALALGATACTGQSTAQTINRARSEVDQLQTVGLSLIDAFGRPGVYLFAITLFVCCFGAATELSLALPFEITQIMGWKYGVDETPAGAVGAGRTDREAPHSRARGEGRIGARRSRRLTGTAR